MKLKTLYLVLGILATVVIYWEFLPWLVQNGPNVSLFFQQVFANRISASFGIDIIASAVVLMIFVTVEGRRTGVRWLWIPWVALVTVGVVLALASFLYLREVQLERMEAEAK